MSEVEVIGRVMLGICLLMALCLGGKMFFRKEEVAVTLKEGFTKYRWPFEVIVGVMAAWYVVSPALRPAWMIITLPLWLQITGLILTVASWTVRVTAQVNLGPMWSEKIRLRTDHKLVRSGLYRYVSHPIYFSYVTLAVGFFLLTGDWIMGCAGVCYTCLSLMRMPQEKVLLLQLEKLRSWHELTSETQVVLHGCVTPETTRCIAQLEDEMNRIRRGLPVESHPRR
ncbi:MAG: Isoprenylcysteine carboxyl methyltransferase [Candidatus Magasanikbacteria bacterium]|nr:Isoprenylcysteine carboxyl methyltransferase [Candidatus Magasanikbacteria bacterium]